MNHLALSGLPPAPPPPAWNTASRPDEQPSRPTPRLPVNLPKPVLASAAGLPKPVSVSHREASGFRNELSNRPPDPDPPHVREPLVRAAYSRTDVDQSASIMEDKEVSSMMNDLDEVWDQRRLTHRSPARSPMKQIPAPMPIDLPDRVYMCFCRVSIHNEHYEAGILELAGSGGAKAFCLFLNKHIITKSNRPLTQQLQVNTVLKVNANLVSQENRVPYLASVAWFEDGPCGPDYVPPPKEEDFLKYHQLVHSLSAALFGPDPRDQVSPRRSQEVPAVEIPGGYGQGLPYSQGSTGNSLLTLPNPVPQPRMVPAPTLTSNSLPTPVPIASKNGASEGYTAGEVWKAINLAQSTVSKKPPVKKQSRPKQTSKLTKEFMAEKQDQIASASQDQSKALEEEESFERRKRVWEKQKKALDDAKKEEDRLREQEKKREEEKRKGPANPLRKKLSQLINQNSTPAVPVIEIDDIDEDDIEKQINELQEEVNRNRKSKKRQNPDQEESSSSASAADIYKTMFGQWAPSKSPDRGRRGEKSKSRSVSESPSPSRPKKSKRKRTSGKSSEPSVAIVIGSPLRNEGGSRSGSKSRSSSISESNRKSKSPRRSRHRSKSREKRNQRWKSMSKSPIRSPKRKSKSPIRSPRRKSKSPDRSSTRRRKSKSPRRRSKSPKRRSVSPRTRSHREKSKSPHREKLVGVPMTPSFISKHVEQIMKVKTSNDDWRDSRVRRSSADNREMKESKNGVADMLEKVKSLKADKNGKEKGLDNYIFVMMETEKLCDGHYSQFTQIGASVSKNNRQLSFFRTVLPFHMHTYTKNLVLKNMNSLMSSLNYNHNEEQNTFKFKHVKKGPIIPVTEEKALEDFVGFLRGIHEDGMEIIIFMHSKEAILPLFLSKIAYFKLETEVNILVKGFCDITTCIRNLKLGAIWKKTNIMDFNDVFKYILAKSCPKEVRHCDGVAVLCGFVIRRMLKDFVDYFKLIRCEFSPAKFLDLCAKQTANQFKTSNPALFSDIVCKPSLALNYGDGIEEIEFFPSDKPSETAIVNLKKFDIVDVDDEDDDKKKEDEVEIRSYDTTVYDQRVVIKPGAISTITMLLPPEAENLKVGQSLALEKIEKVQNVKIEGTLKIEVPSQSAKVSMHLASKVIYSVELQNKGKDDFVAEIGDKIVRATPKIDIITVTTPSTQKAEAAEKADEHFQRLLEMAQSNAPLRRKRKKDKGKEKISPEKAENGEARKNPKAVENKDDHLQRRVERSKGSDASPPKPVRSPVKPREEPKKKAESFAPVLPTPVPISTRKESSEKSEGGIEPTQSFWEKQYPCEVRDSFLELPRISTGGVTTQKTLRLRIQENGLPTRWFVGKKGIISENASFKYSLYNPANNPENKFNFYNVITKEAEVYAMVEKGRAFPWVDVIIENITTQTKPLTRAICPAVIHFENPNPNAAPSPFSGTTVGDVPIPGVSAPTIQAHPQFYPPPQIYNLHTATVTSGRIIPPRTPVLAPSASVTRTPILAPSVSKTPVLPVPVPVLPTPVPVLPVPVPAKTAGLNLLPAPVPAKPKEQVLPSLPIPVPLKPKAPSVDHLPAPVPVMSKTSVTNKEALPLPVPTRERITAPVSRDPVPAPAAPEIRRSDLAKLAQSFSRASPDAGNKGTMTIMGKEIQKSSLPGLHRATRRDDEGDLANLPQGDISTTVTFSNNAVGTLPTPVPVLPNPVPVSRDSSDRISSSSQKWLSPEELKVMSIKRLKLACEDVGLSKYGTKEDLLEKLLDYYTTRTRKDKDGYYRRDISEIIRDERRAIDDRRYRDSPRSRDSRDGSRERYERWDRDERRSRSRESSRERYERYDRDDRRDRDRRDRDYRSERDRDDRRDWDDRRDRDDRRDYDDRRDRDDRRYRDDRPRERLDRILDKIDEEIPTSPVKVDEEVLKKIGEIKTNKQLIIDFYTKYYSFSLNDTLEIGPNDKKVATFLLSQLEMFSSQLTMRKVKITQGEKITNTYCKIPDQVTSIFLKDRKPAVTVLIENPYKGTIQIKKEDKRKLIHLRIEQREGEDDDMFEVPEDDGFTEDIDRSLFEDKIYTATTTSDIVIPPKGYYTADCTITLKGQHFVLNGSKLLIVEKTKHHSMKIGMRKNILVPKVFSILEDIRPLGCETDFPLSLPIKLFNSWNTAIRVSNKTNVGDVHMEKDEAFSPVEFGAFPIEDSSEILPKISCTVECEIRGDKNACFEGQFAMIVKNPDMENIVIVECLAMVCVKDDTPTVPIKIRNIGVEPIVISKLCQNLAKIRLQKKK